MSLNEDIQSLGARLTQLADQKTNLEEFQKIDFDTVKIGKFHSDGQTTTLELTQSGQAEPRIVKFKTNGAIKEALDFIATKALESIDAEIPEIKDKMNELLNTL